MGIMVCPDKTVKDSAQTAIILAGGMARRMGNGCDKAFLNIGGKPIIHRQLDILKRIFKTIIIVTNSPDRYKYFKDIKLVCDVVRKKGPLGGIYSGLLASNSFYNFVVACDIPFINAELIKQMITLKDGFDIVVPRIKNRYEALFAIYSKNCIEPICKAMKKDKLKVSELFGSVRVREFADCEIAKFGDSGLLFMNVNTKEDVCKIAP